MKSPMIKAIEPALYVETMTLTFLVFERAACPAQAAIALKNFQKVLSRCCGVLESSPQMSVV